MAMLGANATIIGIEVESRAVNALPSGSRPSAFANAAGAPEVPIRWRGLIPSFSTSERCE
jgi:hypothetical protein